MPLREDRHHLVAQRLDHLLPRSQALQDLLRGGLLANALDQLLHDLQVDVRLEEGQTDLAQAVRELGLGQVPVSPERAERLLQAFGERFEHSRSGPSAPLRRATGGGPSSPSWS